MLATRERTEQNQNVDYQSYTNYVPRSSYGQQVNSAYQPTQQRNDEYTDYLWNKLNGSSQAATYNPQSYYAPAAPVRTEQQFRPVEYTRSAASAQVKPRRKLNTQSKVILAVYIAVVLLITALVIVNAEVINGTDASDLPITSVTADPFATNADGLHFMAAPSERTVETNWFDSFCDKLNDTFGSN